MATQARLPDDGPSYDADLAGWAYSQSATLLELRPSGIDWANIAEELKDLGNAQFKAFVSAIELVIAHLLKWDHQPERRGNSWAATIRVQRDHFLTDLAANPSFKSRIDEALAIAWRRGVSAASAEMDVPLRDLPTEWPYTWQQLVNRPIDWPEA